MDMQRVCMQLIYGNWLWLPVIDSRSGGSNTALKLNVVSIMDQSIRELYPLSSGRIIICRAWGFLLFLLFSRKDVMCGSDS